MGCATLFALILFLGLAFIGGGLWAVRHVRDKYSAPEPLPLVEAAASDLETVVEQAPTAPPVVAQPETAPATGTRAASAAQTQTVSSDWKTFEKAADRNERARIELSAGEINGLLAAGRNTRGKASVSIQDNVGRVQVSIPIKNVFMMDGRYFNSEASIQASPDGDPKKVRISNISISGQSVPDNAIDQSLFGWPSIRTMLNQWLDEHQISTFTIQDNRAIGETRGQ